MEFLATAKSEAQVAVALANRDPAANAFRHTAVALKSLLSAIQSFHHSVSYTALLYSSTGLRKMTSCSLSRPLLEAESSDAFGFNEDSLK